MAAKLQDVAKKAGVSVATVSRALHSTYPVAQETLDRIREAMNELNYVPNDEVTRQFLERNVRKAKRTGNIGLILGDVFKKFSDPFWSRVLDGVHEEARQQRYHLRFTFTQEDIGQEESHHLIHPDHIDGLILLSHRFDVHGRPSVEYAISPDLTVAVERPWESPLLCDNVVIEKRYAMHTLVDHLIASGRRNFRFLSGLFEDERTAGFIEAMRHHGVPLAPDFYVQTFWDVEEAYPVILSLLKDAGSAIDALVCSSDMIAIAAIRAAEASGLRVPHDIAITGFDDLPLVGDLDPPLTTIHVPKELLGRLAVRKLVERIQTPDLPPIIQVVPTTLVIRRSSGAASPL